MVSVTVIDWAVVTAAEDVCLVLLPVLGSRYRFAELTADPTVSLMEADTELVNATSCEKEDFD